MATTAKKKPQQPVGYDDNSITSLKGADRVRKRPAVIFGSDGLEGCEHSFFEILSNAVDEAKEGHGSVIKVTRYNDNSLEVDDHGRGVPLGWNEREQRWNWDLIYCELYAGGKYDNNSSASAYEFSLGLNGLGACATQYSSEFMIVTSYDGKTRRQIHFKKGEVASELEETPLDKKSVRTGTTIRWKPDLDVFTEINIPFEYFKDMLHRQAVVNAGVRFDLAYQHPDGSFENQSFVYTNGIIDYVKETVGEAALLEPVQWHLETRGRDRDDKEDYRLKADIVFCASRKIRMAEYYHNSSFLELGGSPANAVSRVFPYMVEKHLKNNPKFKGEIKIPFQDVADSLVIVINSFSTQTSYANQTKKAITNTFIQSAIYEFLKEKLEVYFIEHPVETEAFVNQVLLNKKARETAEKTFEKVTNNTFMGNMDVSNRVEKFVSCRSKDPALRELYIVEGDSALTSVKLARNAEFQAVIPVRGKTLNCLKADYDRIFKSEIITDLLRVIGCGVELDGKISKKKNGKQENTFDLNQLKWSKIILCTDADEDGFQIRTLLLTLFYRLLPTLLKEGRVYIAETPLFEIKIKDETLYAYDEFEKADILKRLGNSRYTIKRSKGLGENSPKMMSYTTMDPATRHLIRVTPTDAAATAVMFDTLLGDDLPARKAFIALHGQEYAKDADI